MHHIEKKNMNELKKRGVIEWKRYFDDTFVLKRSVTDLNSILEFLNKTHLSLKFTFKLEKNNTIPFLNVQVKKEQEKLTERKPSMGFY